MNPATALRLAQLAESWRTKAAQIEVKYRAKNPNLVDHVVAAFETCAQELEDDLKKIEPTPSAGS